MRIAIAGLGRVGTALGILIRGAGHEIASAYDTASEPRRRFADRVSDTVVESLEDLCDGTDMLLMAVPDRAISALSEALARLPRIGKGLFVGHTSGALGSEELHHLKARGCSTFSLHPAQTFASIESAVRAMPHSYFTIEGAPDAVQFVEENIVGPIGARCIRINASSKPIYHASLSAASNFLVPLLNLALTLNARAGIDPAVGYEMILPLIETTLENFKTSGAEALTGPIERGDFVTIEKHLDVVAELDPELQRLYLALGRSTVDLARDKGSINQDQSKRLEAMFRCDESEPCS